MSSSSFNFLNFLFSILKSFAFICAVLAVVLYFFQERLLFPGSKLDSDHIFRFSQNFEEINLSVNGQTINSLLFKPENPKGLILYFHGNAGNLASWGEEANELSAQTQFSTWIIDYPGYGKSSHSIASEEQLHEIAAHLSYEAKKIEANPQKTIYFGRSIGTGLAVKLATESPPGAVILETPYVSLLELMNSKLPVLPHLIARYTMRSDLWFAKINSPILVIHGTEDEIIPFSHGKALAALNPKSVFVEIKGGHHNDLSVYSDYFPRLKKFLETL